MKKNFLLIVCAVALVLGFSSCGGSKALDALEVVPNVGCATDTYGEITPYCGVLELVSATPVSVKVDEDFDEYYYHFVGNLTLKRTKDVDSIPNELNVVISYCNENGVVLYSMLGWTSIDVTNLLKMELGVEQSFDYEFQGPKAPIETWLHNGQGTIITGEEADDLLKDVKKIKVEVRGVK